MKAACKNSQPASTTSKPRFAHAPTAPTRTAKKDTKLTAWLRQQAKKLKTLKAEGTRLKLDFVANARAQGKILASVKKRLASTPGKFKEWVESDTDIGYSTALLWIDVAQSQFYSAVNARVADSNPLESTIRQIRDAIRDERQSKGKGKPGSGKTKAATKTAEAHPAALDADLPHKPYESPVTIKLNPAQADDASVPTAEEDDETPKPTEAAKEPTAKPQEASKPLEGNKYSLWFHYKRLGYFSDYEEARIAAKEHAEEHGYRIDHRFRKGICQIVHNGKLERNLPIMRNGGYEVGPVNYVQKPFNPSEYRKFVEARLVEDALYLVDEEGLQWAWSPTEGSIKDVLGDLMGTGRKER